MAFNINKLTVKAQETIQMAVDIAQNYNNQMIEPEHIFAALIQDSGGTGVAIINKVGGNIRQIQLKTNELLEKLPKITGSSIGNQQLSNYSIKMLDDASIEARNLKDEYVSNEHILLALSSGNSAVSSLSANLASCPG